jgi:hypothetical protein
LLVQVQGMEASVRARQNHGAQSSWQTPCGAGRSGQCARGRPLWLPLREQARRRRPSAL